MNSTTLDDAIKLAQKYFNKKEFIQFINPILIHLENHNKQLINQDIKKKLDFIINSSLSEIQTKSESINDCLYIKYEDIEQILKNELNIYT